jgi:C4-dicarboxylate-binding protein DctP
MLSSSAFGEIKIKEIKFAMTVPMDDVGGVGLKVFLDEIQRLSDGKITVQTFTGAQLGSVKAHFEAAQSGGMDIVYAAASAVGGTIPEINIIDLPFFFPDDYNDCWKVMDGNLSQKIGGYLGDRMGLEFMGFSSYGYKQLHTTKKIIKTLDDVRGMKIRVLPSKLLISEIRAWGGVPTPIDFSEVYTALQQGVVDGGENSAHGVERVKWHEVQKGLTVTYHGNFLGLMVANKKWFDSLTTEEKSIVLKACQANIKAQRDYLIEDEEPCIERLGKKGMTIYRLSDEDKKKFIKASEPVWNEYANENETCKEVFEIVKSDIEKLGQ